MKVLNANPPHTSPLTPSSYFIRFQFGDDISAEIGEGVRILVLELVNSAISIEEFHSKLQVESE